jgi:hypothetical protein
VGLKEQVHDIRLSGRVRHFQPIDWHEADEPDALDNGKGLLKIKRRNLRRINLPVR